MDTWWWVALGVVMLLALVAALVDGTGRLGPRRRGRRRGGSADGTSPAGGDARADGDARTDGDARGGERGTRDGGGDGTP